MSFDGGSMSTSWTSASLLNVTFDLFNSLPRRKRNANARITWWSTMGAKDLSTTQLEFFEACRRGDLLKVAGYINGKKNKRPKTPLSLFRPGTPQTGWLAAIRDPSSLYTPLHTAALNGHTNICRLLAENDCQQALTRDKRDCIPLHLAAWNGHTEIVKLLLDFCGETLDAVNCAQETPLHLAAQHGHASVTKILLMRLANPHLRNARGESPLDIAARTGHANVCQFILSFFPEIALQSATDSSNTSESHSRLSVYPLHAAARHSHIDCLAVLHGAGLDIDYVTNEGSALHVAAVFGQIEACRFLIEQGVNPFIRDSQGRTVMQLLEEQQSQRASELTHVIQSRDGWAECATVILEYAERYEQCNINSSSDSGIDGRDERECRREREQKDRDDIWKPLPRTAESTRDSPAKRLTAMDSCSSDSYRKSSTSSSEVPNGYGTVGRKWCSNMYDPVKGTPRFPVTSPYLLKQHNSVDRRTSTMPCASSSIRTNPKAKRGTILPDTSCHYQPPPFESIQRHNERTPTAKVTYNPIFPYDNVPNNSASYRGHRSHGTWDHPCSSGGSMGPAVRSYFEDLEKSRDGLCTLPPVISAKRTRPRVGVNTFSPIAEASPNEKTNGRESSERPIMGSVRSLRDYSLGLSGSPRLTPRAGSRQSSVTFACSTLERSSSPSVAEPSPSGQAPLALPEEMSGSTSASVMSSLSPERDIRSMSLNPSAATSVTVQADSTDDQARLHNYANHRSTDTVNLSMTSLTIEDAVGSPPSPNTSERKIFSTLVNNSGVGTKLNDPQQSRKTVTSPTTTERSDSTVASSCSLPMISQISTSPTSLASPRREWNQPISLDDSNNSSVRLRADSSKNSSDKYDLDEQEEWNKIEGIMSSFGSSICRESVFAADFENKVALYLRDRRSQAITLKRSTPLSSTSSSAERVTAEKEDQNQVHSWLLNRVGITPAKVAELTDLMVENGFDRVEQMHGSLSREWMNHLGVDEDSQARIIAYLSTVEDRRPTAAHFDYLSDWLCSIELIEYLGNFVNAGFKSMLAFRCADFTFHDYQINLGISVMGHVARIMYSLEEGKREDERSRVERTESMKRAVCNQDQKMDKSEEMVADMKKSLTDDNISFSAHYLGSCEISNVDGTDESRRAMAKLKKHIRDMAKVQTVTMEISVNGVNIIDSNTKDILFCHDVANIQIVCQDKRDLNCFTYISQDGNRYYCHVFCVLTADVATDVILVLGQTFQIAYGRTLKESA